MKRLVLIGILLLFVSANMFAYTYGYVIMRGKKAKALDENLQMMSLHIKNWANGEVLLQHKDKKGVLFLKKFTYTVFFKGPSEEVRDLLRRSPWEGDILKEVAVKITINTFPSSDNRNVYPISTHIYRTFTNPVEAFKYYNTSSEKKIMRMFAQKNNPSYKEHMKYGNQREVTFTFYSTRPSEKNKIITLLMK